MMRRRTTTSSVEENESEQDGAQHGNQIAASVGTIVSGVAASISLVIGAAVIFWYYRRQRVMTASQSLKVNSKSTRSTTAPSTKQLTKGYTSDTRSQQFSARSTQIENVTVTQHTRMDNVTTHELSIPAFLQMRFGLDFRQEQYITKGGHGAIYACSAIHHALLTRSMNQPLVVKVISEDFGRLSERQKNAFWQELAIMYKFRDHRNFVKVYAYDLAPCCVVMKYYLGDLDDFISGNSRASQFFRYSKFQLILIFKQYCEGIAYMHRTGIVHCDVKPGNVLLDVSPPPDQRLVVAIADFGISRVVTQESLAVQAFKVSDLRGASVSYAAPDVFFRFRSARDERNPNIWKAADVYALSITLLEMLKRKSPWL